MTSICQLLSEERQRQTQQLPPGPWGSWLLISSHSPVQRLRSTAEGWEDEASPHLGAKVKISHVQELGGFFDRCSRKA